MIDTIIKETLTNTAKQYNAITRAGIFGSYARGEQTEESDIDILFDRLPGYESLKDVELFEKSLKRSMRKVTNNKNITIDFVPYNAVVSVSEETDQEAFVDLKHQILSEVVWVYERGEQARGNESMG